MFDGCCRDRQDEFNQNFVGENDINMDIDVNFGGNAMMAQSSTMGCAQQPIVEPMQEKVVHRTIVHEVPQV